MTCDLLVISDGRGYLRESIPSLIANADPGWFTKAQVLEDGPRTGYLDEAADLLNEWGVPTLPVSAGFRHGGAKMIQAGWWQTLNSHPPADYVFHLEEDWTFNGPVPLPGMIEVLTERTTDCANVALRRQPWGAEGPGGYIGDDPESFTEYSAVVHDDGFLAHRKGFWLNPCVYRREIMELGWPDNGHEHDFTARCLDAGYSFAVYGTKDDPPRVTHIGNERSPSWTW